MRGSAGHRRLPSSGRRSELLADQRHHALASAGLREPHAVPTGHAQMGMVQQPLFRGEDYPEVDLQVRSETARGVGIILTA